MDKKKTLIQKMMTTCLLLLTMVTTTFAQNVKRVKFCDKKYEYGIGKDSISIYFSIIDPDGKPIRNISDKELNNYLVIKEDGQLIPPSKAKISSVNTGLRIPSEFTFSVLIDLSIPDAGKSQIFQAIGKLVENAPQGCVYLSIHQDAVSPSM